MHSLWPARAGPHKGNVCHMHCCTVFSIQTCIVRARPEVCALWAKHFILRLDCFHIIVGYLWIITWCCGNFVHWSGTCGILHLQKLQVRTCVIRLGTTFPYPDSQLPLFEYWDLSPDCSCQVLLQVNVTRCCLAWPHPLVEHLSIYVPMPCC